MKKKLGLLLLASTTLIAPSCARKVRREVAAQLVSTYTYFSLNKTEDEEGNSPYKNTVAMINKVEMSWNYGSEGKDKAKALVAKLTNVENPKASDSVVLKKENDGYDCFFEIYQSSDKKYEEDITKWNLVTSEPAPTFSPIFDTYFPEKLNLKYSTKANDLYIEGAVARINLTGSGKYHYDSKGRLVNASLHIDKFDDVKINLSYNVNASYNN